MANGLYANRKFVKNPYVKRRTVGGPLVAALHLSMVIKAAAGRQTGPELGANPGSQVEFRLVAAERGI